MVKTRRTRATTVDGAVQAMQNVLADPLPPPWPMTKRQRTVWDEILMRRSRDEWQPIDLRYAWDLSEVICRLKEEKNRLRKEGFIIIGERGSKPNPRAQVVRLLSAQAIALARYLRIHPGSDYRDPSLVRGSRQADLDARATITPPPKRPTVDGRRRARLLPQ